MTNKIERKLHKIDATGEVLGRLASRIALILRGKNKATFNPWEDMGDEVEVINAAKIKLTGNKLAQKVYRHYSGYPGGLKTKKASDLITANPGWMLRKAILNMLPKNKLQARMIKRLKISK